MSIGLTIFTLFHVAISLVGIVSGFVVAYGLLTARRLDGWTAIFLTTTVTTSVKESNSPNVMAGVLHSTVPFAFKLQVQLAGTDTDLKVV